ncbi:UBX domain-containing protein 1 [Penicillium chermesinum]|uniref:UBX domain-containing protein 1 n=1 Tax=Penicillium chermesinum TaxID=63820 RepID=A0A9W9NSC4_9EURO|nr:UBX domain-containing protein 1 [Penicillium chermesinum]KAJ5223749.1 UBX domain-containing protein 1 [Penicillium chermesinum]
MDNYPAEQDEIVSQLAYLLIFERLLQAIEYLSANHGDIEAAVTEFFAEQDEALQDANPGGGQRLGTEESSAGAAAGRTLGGSGMPASTGSGSASTSKRAAPKKRFATLGDFASQGADDSSEEDGSVDQDFFAGGEKSGLAVQNPDDLKKKILEKARRAQPPPAEESQPRPSHFTGTARTLGGDEAPSRVIEDPSGPAPQRPQRVQRTLHFWSDGFSVDDGELYRSDDPRNAEILEGIRQGRAPLAIMNVQAGQEVDVELKQHEEKYVKPKPKYKPFSGVGQRLGSPTPGVPSQASTPSSTTPANSSESAAPPQPPIDESQPTVTLQIRLCDGTRLTSRFNTTATIGDVQELNDRDVTLGDLPDFKRGGVVVQKWK